MRRLAQHVAACLGSSGASRGGLAPRGAAASHRHHCFFPNTATSCAFLSSLSISSSRPTLRSAMLRSSQAAHHRAFAAPHCFNKSTAARRRQHRDQAHTSSPRDVAQFRNAVDSYLRAFHSKENGSVTCKATSAKGLGQDTRRKLSDEIERSARSIACMPRHRVARHLDESKMHAMLVALRYHGEECISLYRAFADIDRSVANDSNTADGVTNSRHASATLESLGRYAQALNLRGHAMHHPRHIATYEGVLADMSFVLNHMKGMRLPSEAVPLFVWNMMFDACANAPDGTCLYALQHMWDAFCRRHDLVHILERGTATAANSITMNSLVACAANMRGGARRLEVEQSQGHLFLGKDHFFLVNAKNAEKSHTRSLQTRFEVHLQANAQSALGTSDPSWADEILDIMGDLGFWPRGETFNRVIACYANSNSHMSETGGMGRAAVMFERMQEEGFRPNVFTHNAMIASAAGVEPRLAKRELAEYYFSGMKRQVETSSTNNIAVFSRASEIYKNEKYDAPEESPSTLFVAGLSTATEPSTLERAFAPWGNVLSTVIVSDRNNDPVGFIEFASPTDTWSAYLKMQGYVLDGSRLYLKLKANGQTKGRGKHQRGRKMKRRKNRRKILKEGVSPNSDTFLALLRAYAYNQTDGADPSRAWGLISSMRNDFGHPPSADHFSVLLEAIAHERGGCVMRKAGAVLKEMAQQHVRVTEDVLASYLECCANAAGGSPKGADMVKAEAIWTEALQLAEAREKENRVRVARWEQRGREGISFGLGDTTASAEEAEEEEEEEIGMGSGRNGRVPIVPERTLRAMLRCCANAPHGNRDWGERAEYLFLLQLEERRNRHRQNLIRQERRHDEWLALETEYRLAHYGVGGYDWVDKNRVTAFSSNHKTQKVVHDTLPPDVLWETRERAKWRRDFLSWDETRESELPSEDVFAQLVRATARTRPKEWFDKMQSAEFFEDAWGPGTKITPTLKSHNALLSTLSKYHSLDKVVRAFDQMLAEGIDPDATAYGHLIAAYLASPTIDHRIEQATSTFEEMMANDRVVAFDYLVCDTLITAFDDAAHDPGIGQHHGQALLALADRVYSKAVRLELYGDLESAFAENIKKKKAMWKRSGGGNSHGVFHLEGKPLAVAKAAIRHLLSTLRQNPALTGMDVLVCTGGNARRRSQIMRYLKEDLRGPAMSELRGGEASSREKFDENKIVSNGNFWLLHRDVVQWCAWPPRRISHLGIFATPKVLTSPDHVAQKRKKKSYLMGFPGPVLSPPDMPVDGEQIAKFQVVSKEGSAEKSDGSGGGSTLNG